MSARTQSKPLLSEIHAAKVSVDFDATMADVLASPKLRHHPGYSTTHRSQMAQLIGAQLNPPLQRYIQNGCGPIPRVNLQRQVRLRPAPRFRMKELSDAIGSLLEQIAASRGSSISRSSKRSWTRQTAAFVRAFVLRDPVLSLMLGQTA
jgi:hypothetical protein